MTLEQTMQQLESLTDERTRKRHLKNGADENLFGVKLGDLRKVAKKIKTNHQLALSLWQTGNLDARLLAILILKPEDLSTDELEQMVQEATFFQLADWVNSYVVKPYPDNESLRKKWMQSSDPMLARAGWNLTAQRVVRQAEILDLSALLDRLENEMGEAPAAAQWTMNFTLGYIGIHHEQHRERALAIGEKLGLYRDYPVSKGCTSPFVPIWINEMVSRQEG